MRDLAQYNRRLQRRHPYVRVRRHEMVRDLYVLEERYGRGAGDRADPSDFTNREKYVQTRDGYTTIEFFRSLPAVSRLSDALHASRVEALLQRAGVSRGGKDDRRVSDELADKMDAENDAANLRRRAGKLDQVGELAGEVWEHARWQGGSRVAVPS